MTVGVKCHSLEELGVEEVGDAKRVLKEIRERDVVTDISELPEGQVERV